MERSETSEREGWEKTVEESGLLYHRTEWPDGSIRRYWAEGTYYGFSDVEIRDLERASDLLSYMCQAAANEVITHNRFAELGIPQCYERAIKNSWDSDPPSIYGRFDLQYDGVNPPKMLEFNADTPTGLLESAVTQWKWLEDRFPELDQFNSIHDKLIAAWKKMGNYIDSEVVHVAHSALDNSGEDLMNAAYMHDVLESAGLTGHALLTESIGWNSVTKQFVDRTRGDEPIKTIFKLWPWEWLADQEPNSYASDSETKWIEPMWKMVLSNKGILALLWELFPNHPNLLPAYLGHPHNLTDYVRKPLLSREGANITIVRDGQHEPETEGMYGEEGYVFQQLAELPNFDGNYPVIGSWLIDWEPAGLGIRESDGLITDNLSRFVPHVIL